MAINSDTRFVAAHGRIEASVLERVVAERKRQDAIWGKDHDDTLDAADFFSIIEERCADKRGVWEGASTDDMLDDRHAAQHLIEIAALAVAGAAALTRKIQRHDGDKEE